MADDDLTGMQKEIQEALTKLFQRLRDLDAIASSARTALTDAIASETEDDLLRQRLKRMVTVVQQIAAKAEITTLQADAVIDDIKFQFDIPDIGEAEESSPTAAPHLHAVEALSPEDAGSLSDTGSRPGQADTGAAQPLRLIYSAKESKKPSEDDDHDDDGDEPPDKPNK